MNCVPILASGRILALAMVVFFHTSQDLAVALCVLNIVSSVVQVDLGQIHTEG